MDSLPYILVIVAVIVVAIIGAIVWSITLREQPTLATGITLAPASYGARCLPDSVSATPSAATTAGTAVVQHCGDGLVCIKAQPSDTTGFCKKALGTTCTTVSECEPAAIVCSTVCSTTTVGGLDQPCQTTTPQCISDSLVCEASSQLCKLKPNSTGCNVDSDCYQSICVAVGAAQVKTCIPQLPNGGPCTNNKQCISNNCSTSAGSTGSCQPPGTSAGTLGAACVTYLPGASLECPSGTGCVTDFDSASSAYGVCAVENSTWAGGPCSQNSACVPPSICWDGLCVMPRTSSSLATNSCAPGVSSGICLTGYTCSNGQLCQANSSQSPAQAGSNTALFRWDPVANASWTNVATLNPPPILGPNDTSTLSALSSTTQGSLGTDIILYRGSDMAFYLLKVGGTSTRLTIVGPYNGTVQLTGISNLQFQVDAVKFTPGGQIAILYSWLYTSASTTTRVSRIWLQPTPASWFTNTPTTTLTYGITWTGMTPNTNVTAGSAQQTDGDFDMYPELGGIPLHASIFDIDDTTLPNGRVLFVSTDSVTAATAADLLAYSTDDLTTALNNPGSATYSDQVTASNIYWAQFYSAEKGLQQPQSYLYTLVERNTQILISTPPTVPTPLVAFSPETMTHLVLNVSLYSPPGALLAGSIMFYLADYQADGGLTIRSVTNNQDLAVPGYITDTSQTTLSFPNVATTTFIPTAYLVAPATS